MLARFVNGVNVPVGPNFDVTTEVMHEDEFTSSPGIEKPEEISVWLDTLRELEKLGQGQSTSSRPGSSGADRDSSFSKIDENNVELPSPDQLFKWLDSIPPLDGSKVDTEKQNGNKESTHHNEPVNSESRHILESQLILIISVCVGTVILVVALLAIVIVLKRKHKSSKLVHEKVMEAPKNQTVYTLEGQEVFMGIPTNNQIWKELQTLPPTASSVVQ